MPIPTYTDRLLEAVKNNRYVAVIMVAATVIGAVGQLTGAFEKVIYLIWPDGRDRAVYRPLVGNLRNLERTLNDMASLKDNRDVSSTVVKYYVDRVRVAAEPVCNARGSVSELGDNSTREELDRICETPNLMKIALEVVDGSGWRTPIGIGIVVAPKVKQLREALLPRT